MNWLSDCISQCQKSKNCGIYKIRIAALLSQAKISIRRGLKKQAQLGVPHAEIQVELD